MDHIGPIKQATIVGNIPRVIELTDLALKAGVAPEAVIQQGFIPAMEVVGDKFAIGQEIAGLKPVRLKSANRRIDQNVS